jgi:hypothetical protein
MAIWKKFCSLSLVLSYLLIGTAHAGPTRPERILFVGNSLTYVGNLPAVFTALAAENGHSVQTGMIVKGGATLTQWLHDGSVPRALAAGHYDDVVLQERGDDFACGFGPQVCKDSRYALHALAGIVRKAGAKPILLGTYQVAPDASQAIVAAESKAARNNALPYIAVSGRLNEGRKKIPYADWFARGGHPGHDLVLLEAVLLYRQLYASLPQAKALQVRAPMFVPGSKFTSPAPLSLPLLPEVPLAGGYSYSRSDLQQAIGLATGN